MVQNMIYGLQASQNALAVAMQPDVPNKRRRKSTSSDGSGRSSATRPGSATAEFYATAVLLRRRAIFISAAFWVNDCCLNLVIFYLCLKE